MVGTGAQAGGSHGAHGAKRRDRPKDRAHARNRRRGAMERSPELVAEIDHGGSASARLGTWWVRLSPADTPRSTLDGGRWPVAGGRWPVAGGRWPVAGGRVRGGREHTAGSADFTGRLRQGSEPAPTTSSRRSPRPTAESRPHSKATSSSRTAVESDVGDPSLREEEGCGDRRALLRRCGRRGGNPSSTAAEPSVFVRRCQAAVGRRRPAPEVITE